MKFPAYMVVMVFAAGCGDHRGSSLTPQVPPADADADVTVGAPFDGNVDGPIDTGIDTPPPRLAELCGAEPITLDDWEDCYHKRWCEWIVGCRVMNKYRNVQECLDRSNAVEGGRLAAERRARTRAVAVGRASINIPMFTQCLLDTDNAFCSTAQSSAACATRFTGTTRDGGACQSGFECASPGATCPLTCTDTCCTGTCRPKFKLGEVCNTFTSCEPGLECDQICFSGDIGTPCTDDWDCDANAWCKAGRCAATYAPYDQCTNPLQCGGQTTCVGLTIISSTPGSCLPIAHAGDHCDGFCYGNLYCDASGTCRDLPVLGERCAGSGACRGADTICRSGECVLRGDLGAPCDNQSCLPELFCTSDLNDPDPTCVARRSEGGTCTAPAHCQSYICSGNKTDPGQCMSGTETCSSGGS